MLADNLAGPASPAAPPSASKPVATAAAPPLYALPRTQAEAAADTSGNAPPGEPAKMRRRPEASELTPEMVEALLDALTDRLQFEFLRTYGTVR